MKRTIKLWLTVALLGLLSSCQNPLQALFTPSPARQYLLPPEYEPVQGMLVSEHLTSFPNGTELLSTLLGEGAEVWLLNANPDVLNQTRGLLSQRFGLQADQLERIRPLQVATDSVWARDWAPIFAFGPGQMLGLLDLRYYPDRPLDDAVPAQVADFTRKLMPQRQVQALPVAVELEGGNMLCTRSNCFVSEEVLRRVEANQGRTPDPAEILVELEKYIAQEFWIVPRMPYESTGHIDIWAKLLDEKTMIIGQISEESLDAVPAQLQETYREVMRFLDEQALGQDAAGQPSPNSLAALLKRIHPEIRIERVPMPTPGIYQGVETFRTYTNSLLFNEVAVLPRYVRGTRFSRAERDLTREHEQRVEAVYQAAGYRVIWIRADNLIRDGGAWHCVAMQIPDLARHGS
ncbi:MAG: hypothetical protein CVV27_11630 [Candidatus Melainabacteria bacterium HGW-Melainabacteria-1]|nr:MAG: hypothetical protein CVV27_11630 [Candidatus Melainabacteria bacterium HGW-Melainabacteria-1]